MRCKKHNRVMTVGVQSMADPSWREANEMIRAGKIGHVAQAQTSYYRNSTIGQWRYYRLYKDMNPTTIDWDMFLGHNFTDQRRTAAGPAPKECRSTGRSSRSGAATGPSAAACSPTCSSTRRRT